MSTTALTKVGTKNAEQVVLLDDSGNQVSSFGGGTQYADGAAAATPTGTQINWNDGGTQRAVSAAKPLPVTASIDTTGLATSAKQDTIIGHVDGIETILGTIDADTGNIATSTTDLPNVIGTDGSTGPSKAISVAGTEAGGTLQELRVDADGHAQIDVLSSALPTNAAMETGGNLDYLQGIDTNTSAANGLLTTIDADTGGIATSAASIDTKTPALGQALAAASVPVVLTAAQVSTLTPQTDALTDTQLRATAVPVSANDLDIRPLVNTDVVTAELSAVDNAVLDTIDAVLDTIKTDTAALVVDAAATEALLTTIDADTGGILTAVQLIDNAISGNEMQVDVVAALPAGTNNIGDVDVLTLPGTGVEDAAETAGGTLLMSGTVRRDTAASSAGTTGDNATLNTDSLGRLWVSGAAVEDAAETAGGILLMSGSVRRDTAASSAGTTGYNATINTDALGKMWVTGTYAEDAAHTAGETIIGNGVRRIDAPATSAGSSGDWATMDASAEGAIWATLTPTTTGGCSIFRSLDLDETEEDIKTSAGNIYGYYYGNATSSIRYLKFYNATAANVTVGSTTPVLTFLIPASAAGHVAFPYPIGFSTAISAAVTTGVADADTGAPGTNDIILNVFYK